MENLNKKFQEPEINQPHAEATNDATTAVGYIETCQYHRGGAGTSGVISNSQFTKVNHLIKNFKDLTVFQEHITESNQASSAKRKE